MTTQRTTGDSFELGTLVSGRTGSLETSKTHVALLITQRSTVPDSCQNEQAAAVFNGHSRTAQPIVKLHLWR
jgi:hypothetical protein